MTEDTKNWKIYTKTGDKGETSLIGGTRVPKYHDRIEAYGTLDELNAHLGVVHDCIDDELTKNNLQNIIEKVFRIESNIALDPEHLNQFNLPKIDSSDVKLLESEIDRMNETLPILSNFVLPGGNLAASFCHVARCVCRRAERCIYRINIHQPMDALVLEYINRLSDYLFVLSRFICSQNLCIEKKWITK